jgi:predicted GH43/DUF377 family glycosyl hydrolase
MQISRAAMNPLIAPLHVSPTTPDLAVLSAFNAAAVTWGEETLLLLRVAEAPACVAPDEVATPIVNADGQIVVRRFRKDSPGLDITDPRGIIYRGEVLLSSLSHLRLARSRDGYHFTVDPHPALFPTEVYEEYGIEDPRMTLLEGRVYVTYTAVSRWGICVALASTDDFCSFTKHGIILPPENKNVVIFPERVKGEYMLIHRPAAGGLGGLQMWLASSDDLCKWGKHRLLMGTRREMWDSIRIGAGAVPLKTPAGWLEIYHGVSEAQGYCLGAVLLDLDDPSCILGRSHYPILCPDAEYERHGFFNNVVFTCGAVVTQAAEEQQTIRLYYGAADESTCRADIPLDDILESLL